MLSNRTFRRICGWALSVLLVFVVMELGLRLLGARNMVLYERDEAAGYRVKPMQDVRVAGKRVVVNEWGVRDARPFFKRSAGLRRIVVLGDSVTWGGLGIDQSDAFTSVLERRLPDCEVINAGVNGYSVTQMVRLYQTHLKGLDPDMVMVFAIPRDFERPPVVELTGDSVAFPLDRPCWGFPAGIALLRYHLARLTGWDALRGCPSTVARDGETAGEHQIDTHVRALQELKETLPPGTALWVVLCPVTKPLDVPSLEKTIIERVEAAGITCAGLRQAGVLTPNLFMDGVHLTLEGHAAVADALAALLQDWRAAPVIKVRVEEDVYTFDPSNNGSGPLWSYGSTQIIRSEFGVFVSQMETGVRVPPLNNTRWRILERGIEGWRTFAEAGLFRQREPCPLVTLGNELYLSVNDSIVSPLRYNGPCVPGVLQFDVTKPGVLPNRFRPVWGDPQSSFTEHSYRGIAAEPQDKRLLLLHIDNKTSHYHWCYLDEEGETLHAGGIAFPIRACYPQVALQRKAAHVFAVGDIVEPVQEWRKYKFEKTQRTWDYVFRILYYTWTPDILEKDFCAPLEIANVDATAGAVSNLDLWINPGGAAYLLYTEREVASELLRDRFFPDRSTVSSLHLAIVDKGEIVERRVLHEGSSTSQVALARFHETPDGRLYIFAVMNNRNYLAEIRDSGEPLLWVPVPFRAPFFSFCLANKRAGCVLSDTMDIHGVGPVNHVMRYAAVEIR